jgi:hypothetical protein
MQSAPRNLFGTDGRRTEKRDTGKSFKGRQNGIKADDEIRLHASQKLACPLALIKQSIITDLFLSTKKAFHRFAVCLRPKWKHMLDNLTIHHGWIQGDSKST